MIGLTLGRYFALRFLGAALAVFATCFLLVAIVDFVEMMRRAGDVPGVSAMAIATLSLCRVPSLAEQILPFAVLFGAMTTFLYLSRKLEFVVARAAGISAWQFLAPSLITAFLLGIVAITLYNPVSSALKEYALRIEARTLGKSGKTDQQGFSIRQKTGDGQAIIRARLATERGQKLTGVSVYRFDVDGHFTDRIEAETADLEPGAWRLSKARVFQSGVAPQTQERLLLQTNLSADQVRETLSSPDTISFWQMPNFIAAAEQAGLPALKYRLQYQTLLARPLMLVTMVLVAATVGLRFFRLGGMLKMVLAGVVGGFLLYVASQLAGDLGAAGVIHPVVAAWMPAMVASLMGFMVLLHLEDG